MQSMGILASGVEEKTSLYIFEGVGAVEYYETWHATLPTVGASVIDTVHGVSGNPDRTPLNRSNYTLVSAFISSSY